MTRFIAIARLCQCGHILDKRTRGDLCRLCIAAKTSRASARQPDAAYLVDVPRMSDAEIKSIMVADEYDSPTPETDKAIRRVRDAVRAALISSGNFHKGNR